MSRQELYSWAAILSNLLFLLVYVAVVFGIPTLFDPVRDDLIQSLIFLVFINTVIQAIIGHISRNTRAVEKDERDELIESKGFRTGYNVFFVAITILIGHLFTMHMIDSFADPRYVETLQHMPLHYLFFALIAGSSAKSITQLYHYRKEA